MLNSTGNVLRWCIESVTCCWCIILFFLSFYLLVCSLARSPSLFLSIISPYGFYIYQKAAHKLHASNGSTLTYTFNVGQMLSSFSMDLIFDRKCGYWPKGCSKIKLNKQKAGWSNKMKWKERKKKKRSGKVTKGHTHTVPISICFRLLKAINLLSFNILIN